MIEKSNQYGIASTTKNGELVKSRSEKILADYLTINNIKYIYEPELVGIYAKPDFYLPDYDVYVEFWGLIKVSKEYEDNMRRKMAIYHQNNLKFISIYPYNLNNLDYYFRNKFKKLTDCELPNNN